MRFSDTTQEECERGPVDIGGKEICTGRYLRVGADCTSFEQAAFLVPNRNGTRGVLAHLGNFHREILLHAGIFYLESGE